MAGSRPAGAAIGRLMRTAPAGDLKVASPRKDTSPAKQKISRAITPERPSPSSGRASSRATSSSAQKASQRPPVSGNASSSSAAASPRAQRTPQKTPERTAQRTPLRTPQRNRTPGGKGDGKSANARWSPGLRGPAASKSGARPVKTERGASHSGSPLALVLPPAPSTFADDGIAQETHDLGSSRASRSEGVVQAGEDVPVKLDLQGLQDSQIPISSSSSPESHHPPQLRRSQKVSMPQTESKSTRHLRMSSSAADGDNIKVCVRIRPLSASEVADGEVECVHENSRISSIGGQHSDECWGGLLLASTGSDGCVASPKDSRQAPPWGQTRSEPSRSNLADESYREKVLPFSFDWVIPSTAGQQTVYDLLGERVVQGVAEGFHGCFFAYGQTGSGKSHTIFGGPGEDRGLLLRISEHLFNVLNQAGAEYIVKLSYLEIYNEKIRDLLRPVTEKDVNSSANDLQIRHHPKVGVFVEGLMSNVIQGPEEVARLLDYGHTIRAVGRTNMNAASSRSHAVVTLNVEFKSFMNDTQSEEKEQEEGMLSSSGQENAGKKKGKTEENAGKKEQMKRGARTTKESKSRTMVRRRACLHSVDLAGSERLSMAGSQQIRQKESKEINKSLWALSLMISKLASQESQSQTGHQHIPYRNSKLTYLLSDSLMGNCRTVMLACIAPSSSSYRFTESTLRFAASAKKIRTRPVKNEELDGDLVTSLRSEIEQLRLQLEQMGSITPPGGSDTKKDIQEKLATTQLLQKELGASWEEQHAQAAAYENERSVGLQNLGLSNSLLLEAYKKGETSRHLIKADAEPYLVNVCDDPLLSGCLTYMLPRGERIVVGSAPSCEIQIDGLGVLPWMCSLISRDGKNVEVSCVDEDEFEEPKELTKRSRGGHSTYRRGSLVKGRKGVAQVFVNNELVQKKVTLHNGERLRIGHAHVFQAFIPQQAQGQVSRKSVDLIESDIQNPGEQILAKEYHAHLKERLGADRTREVFRRLKELTPLVDEANDMTDELRGDESFEMVFKAHVLTDITSTSEDPELAVVMRVTEKPDDIKEDGSLLFNPTSGRAKAEYTTSVWSLQKFMHRIEVMRDLYHEVSSRQEAWGLPNDLDPWSDDMIHVAEPDSVTHRMDYVHHVGSPRTRVESTSSAHGLSHLPKGSESNGAGGDGSPGGAEAGSGAAETSTAAPSATPSAAGEMSGGSLAEVPKTMRRKGSEPDAEPSDEGERLALRLPVLEVALHNALTGLAEKEAELQQLSSRQEELQAAVAAKDDQLKQLPTIELELRCAAAERDMLAAQLARAARMRSGQSADDDAGTARGAATLRQAASATTAERAGSVGRDHAGNVASVGIHNVESTPQKTAGLAQTHDSHLASAASIMSGSIRAGASAHPHVASAASLMSPGSLAVSGSLASLGGSITPRAMACSSTPRTGGAAADARRMIPTVAWPSAGSMSLTPGITSLKPVAVLPAAPRSGGGSTSLSPLHRTRSQPRTLWPPATSSQGCSVVTVSGSNSPWPATQGSSVVVPVLPVGTAQERIRRARSAERLAVPVRRARSVEKFVVSSPRVRAPSAEKVFLPATAKTRTRSAERLPAPPGPGITTVRVSRGLSGPAGVRLKQEVHGELGSLRQQLASLNDMVESLCEPPVVQPALPASLVNPLVRSPPSYGAARESVFSNTSGDQCSC